DFDKAAMEKAIRESFSVLTNPAHEKPRPVFNVPDHPGTTYVVGTDKEVPATTVGVYNLLPFQLQATNGDYRRYILESLYAQLLDSRLTELAQKPDAPFLAAGGSHGLLARTKVASTISAVVKEDGVTRGLDALITEAGRISKYGFTATEVDREKQNL